MAHNVESHANTVADALRQLLSEAERQIIKPTAANIEPLLILFDRIEKQIDELAASDMDLRSEQARWEALQNRLQANPGVIVRAARDVGSMATLRTKHSPASGFWWHLDKVYSTLIQKTVRRTVITLIVILVVVVGGWQLINYIFPPDPTAVLLLQAGNQIEEAVSAGDLQGAMTIVDQTLQKTPDAPEMLVWSIILSEKLNDTQRATRDLAHAKELFSDRWPQFLVMLGNQRYQVGDLQGAEQNANEALAIDNKDAQVYLLLASIAEARGDVQTAIDLFQKTYELADNNPQLQVVARYRMGQLMQSAPMQASPVQSDTVPSGTASPGQPAEPTATPAQP